MNIIKMQLIILKNIINKNNARMNKKIISEKNMNQMRPKKGGGRSNKLYQKYGFN